MKEKKTLISRKDVLKSLGGLALGLPFVSGPFGNIPTLKSSLWKLSLSKDFPPLFPFQISHDSPDNVCNFRHLLDTPSGKHGFIRVINGRFVNDLGLVRLNGTNLTCPANFPSHSDAERLGKRLARFGINCVRLHYMDSYYGNFRQGKEQGIIANDPKTQRNLDPKQQDKLDYLISVFKNVGIYVDMNLHVARWWDDRDGFPYQDKRPVFDKGLDNFEPRMIDLQKEYARKLLTHINPYTNLAYTDDPSVAVIEVNNENSLFNQYFSGSIDKLPDPYSSEFRKQWNKWLKNKYGSTEAIKMTWNAPNIKMSESNNLKGKGNSQILLDENKKLENNSIPTVKALSIVPLPAKEDFYQFMLDTEENYWTGMYKFLKNDLRVKSLVYGTQLSHGSPVVQAKLDFIDNHAYWCHPGPVNTDWQIKNISMVNSMDCIKRLSGERVLGKPYTVTEYNHPFPNQYGAESQPMLHAYGRFQGWDGVFEYTYNDRTNFDRKFQNYFFSMIERTDVLAHFPACSAIFLRGDVREGTTMISGSLDYQKYFNHLVKENRYDATIETAAFDISQTMLHKTAVDLSGNSGTLHQDVAEINGRKVFTSDTGELTWNIEYPREGYFTVNTPNSKVFTGFPKGRNIHLGSVELSIGETRLGWATVSLVSRNANGFGEHGKSANILLAATGILENEGMVIVQEPDDKIRLSNWGKGPINVEGIPAIIILSVTPARLKCFALDTKGNRIKQIPIKSSKDNKTKIIIKPEYKTVWYEIAIS